MAAKNKKVSVRELLALTIYRIKILHEYESFNITIKL